MAGASRGQAAPGSEPLVALAGLLGAVPAELASGLLGGTSRELCTSFAAMITLFYEK